MVVAITSLENVNCCAEALVIVPSAPLAAPPTTPVNVTVPVPDPKVKLFAWLVVLFTVSEKVIVLDVAVVNVQVVPVPDAA